MRELNLFSVPKFEIRPIIIERVELLEKVRLSILREMRNMPDGNLSVLAGRTPSSFRYYHRDDPKDKYGKYLGKSQAQLRDELAQKKYYMTLLKNIDDELTKLKRVLSIQFEDSFIETYRELKPGLKKVISPLNVDDKTMITMWLNQSYKGLEFDKEDLTEFYSEKGERMRSKSEVLIANCLSHNDIPYKYECPVIMSNGMVRYPDFTILNVGKRKLFYWEHLGKAGDIDYLSSNMRKIREYKREGIVLGENLFITIESGSMPLSVRDVEMTINNFLK